MEKSHVSEKKKKTVSKLVELINKYPIIGIINMTNLSAKQVQGMRAKLRGKNVLIMTKKTLMRHAFEQSNKKELLNFKDHMKETMPALIFSEENPFKLYADLQKTKTKSAAKAGQKAPKDIVVQAGPTPFSPGPIIGQLGKFGLKTGIEAGKIVIKQDSIVAKKGDTINSELASVLARLGIEPMEIGLDLIAVYENGTIFKSDILHIDEKEYSNKICSAYNEAFNLAVYIAYPTEETIKTLIGKCANDAKALAISQNILTNETTEDILKKAYLEMLSLSNKLNL